MARCPVAAAYHSFPEHQRTADSGADRECGDVVVASPGAKSHLACKECIDVVVADNGTNKHATELFGKRYALEELELGLEPHDLVRSEVDPPRASNPDGGKSPGREFRRRPSRRTSPPRHSREFSALHRTANRHKHRPSRS